MGHTDWVNWAITGGVEQFYESMRWPGWEAEVAALEPDQVILAYPFLWADGPPIAERARKPVPLDEMWRLQLELRRQLAGNGDPPS